MTVTARISSEALASNVEKARSLASSRSKLIAVVKSEAYGHRLSNIATGMRNADLFAVARIDEVEPLRICLNSDQKDNKKPILVLGGISNVHQLYLAIENNCWLVVHTKEQIEILEQAQIPSDNNFKVFLKVDTGMGRLGFKPTDEYIEAANRLQKISCVEEVVLMSHFANADKPESAGHQKQLKIWNKIVQYWPGETSLENSAGLYNSRGQTSTYVRPGIMLYGSSPFAEISAHDLKLKPAMTLESELIAVRNLSIGDTIGYGSRYTVAEETKRIGVIGAGYGDGYPRVQNDNASVLVNGKPCKILGRVCMDTMMVDLDSQPNATVGDRVELWGNGISVDQVAKNNGSEGTIGYELLCRVGVRVKRILAEPPNKNNSMSSELTLKRAS